MEPDQAKGPEEEQSTKDMKAKPSGTKRKFVSQTQFDDLQTTVAEMRSDMASLISLIKDSVTPAKQVFIEEPGQPASNLRYLRYPPTRISFSHKPKAISLPYLQLEINSSL